MSTLWRKSADGWQSVPLDGCARLSQGIDVAGVEIVRVGRGSDAGAAVLVRAGTWARVNGQPVLGGIRVLDDKDEILAGGSRLFFSAQSSPVVVTFRAEVGVRLPTCPVCRGPIREGQRAVHCPGCPRWYHEGEPTDENPARRCWSYAATCSFCHHPTSLAEDAIWMPDRDEHDV